MLNLTSPDLVLVLYIPFNGNAPAQDAELHLSARSTSDEGSLLEFTFQGWELSGTFVKACVEKPAGLHPGEWEYTLADGEGREYSRGLMYVGPMPADADSVQYNNETEYQEYGN